MACTLRVVCGEHDATVLQWVKTVSPAHFVVKHDADEDEHRDHWHVIMWPSTNVQNLRMSFTRKSGVKGNRMYSMKDVDENTLDVFERYLCHGKFRGDRVEIVSAQPRLQDVGKYSQEWCQARNEEFWAAREQVKKERKKKQLTPREEAEAECVAGDITSVADICTVLIERYRDADKPMCVYHMRKEIRLIYSKLNKNADAVRSIRNEILEGMSIR